MATADAQILRLESKAHYWRRRVMNRFMNSLAFFCVLLAIAPLLLILYHLASQGLSYINWDFFTQLPKPPGTRPAGMANAIVGTITLVALGLLVSLPLGIMAGIYLAEFGAARRFSIGWVVRFTTDLLNAAPSIIAGIFAYTIVVLPLGHFSAYAGGIALAVLMIATITRTTEEMVRLVPNSLREAALALGVPRWRMTISIVLRTALSGIMTGVMLAVARAAGETAPLLFTALNNQWWPKGLGEPTPSLTVWIFYYAVSPFKDWHRQAWAAALVLVTMVLLLNVLAKFFARSPYARR